MRKIYLIVLMCFSTVAHSSGVGLHMFMADEALNQLVHKELRTLLTSEQEAVRNGSYYPDSGYPIDAAIAELSHWGEFLNHYIGYIQEHCKMPFEGSCKSNFAHFMGSLAHSVGDMNWDRRFLPQLAKKQFADDINKAQSIDFMYDFLAVIDFNRTEVVPLKYVPQELLAQIYTDLGKNYTSDDVAKGTDSIFMALMGEIFSAPLLYELFKSNLPWTSEHYYDADGGVLDSATKIAQTWTDVWGFIKANRRVKIVFTGGWPNVNVAVQSE